MSKLRSSLKKLPTRVAALQKAYPEAQVEVWAYDEHRLGLQPLSRKVWAKRGERPVQQVEIRYQWLYLYGFVCPQSGQTEWLIMPTVNITVFNLALADFAKNVGAGGAKHILLVLDGAGWHRSGQVVIPAGLHFEFLPAYSPELQPAERLWPLTNEGIANQHWTSLDALEAAQAERCVAVSEATTLVQHTTCYSWWPLVNC